jgi:hypothetical protein
MPDRVAVGPKRCDLGALLTREEEDDEITKRGILPGVEDVLVSCGREAVDGVVPVVVVLGSVEAAQEEGRHLLAVDFDHFVGAGSW